MDLFPPLLRVQLSIVFGELKWLKKTASPKITLPSGAAHSQGWLTWQLQTKDTWASEPPWGQLRPVLTLSLLAFFSSLRIDPKSIAKNILYSGSCISFSIFQLDSQGTQQATLCIRSEETIAKLRISNWITGPPAGIEDPSLMTAAAPIAPGTQ